MPNSFTVNALFAAAADLTPDERTAVILDAHRMASAPEQGRPRVDRWFLTVAAFLAEEGDRQANVIERAELAANFDDGKSGKFLGSAIDPYPNSAA
jgi:hypothetical protein